jgi:hypothetical protein
MMAEVSIVNTMKSDREEISEAIVCVKKEKAHENI